MAGQEQYLNFHHDAACHPAWEQMVSIYCEWPFFFNFYHLEHFPAAVPYVAHKMHQLLGYYLQQSWKAYTFHELQVATSLNYWLDIVFHQGQYQVMT